MFTVFTPHSCLLLFYKFIDLTNSQKFLKCLNMSCWFVTGHWSPFWIIDSARNPYPVKWTQLLVLTPICLRSILILSSHLRLGLPRSPFPEGLPVKVLKAVLFFDSDYDLSILIFYIYWLWQYYRRLTVQTMKWSILHAPE